MAQETWALRCIRCIDCPKYIYKGDDEQYCQAARMREIYLKRWQDKPKWCPLERRARREEVRT